MITTLSAVVLAERIRDGLLSPIEVVEAHIARIEVVNPGLNAIVTTTFDEARQAAQRAADAITRGAPLGPLHGVPFTAKDSLDVAGVRSTTGLIARAEHYPDCDAAVVAQMRAAGAILLGKTNTPDNCWNQETVNLIFGRTNNPWNLDRTVGGSTGGEAAIIAAGGSPLGIGTDIAGSIRLPAHFTGIVGLRPTSATLSEVGNWPPAHGRLADLEAIGPMARRVEDVALAFDVLRGATPQPLDLDALREAPVAAWFDDGLIPSSGAITAGVRAAAEALQQAGMVRVGGSPAARRLAILGWLAYQGDAERRAIARGFGGGVAWSPPRELLAALQGRPCVAPGALLYWLASHYGSLLTRAIGVDGAGWRAQLRAQLHDLIGERGVAVCPIFPTTAPRHGWPKRVLLMTLGYQAWVNLAGLPGLTVPVGRSGNGLPVGVQIVGGPGTERTILAAGLAIQRALSDEL
jgi:amidase